MLQRILNAVNPSPQVWSILVGALAPALIFALWAKIDRRSRKKIEKAPQEEKLLRPPGHSLSRRFDETLDDGIFSLLFSCLCYFAGAGSIGPTSSLVALKAPLKCIRILD